MIEFSEITYGIVVQHAIEEFGAEGVENIKSGDMSGRGGEYTITGYFNMLRSRLAEAYLADNTKSHLREYVDYKFGADLGL